MCPDGRQIYPLLRVVLHWSVSHKGLKITGLLYHEAKNASRKQLNNNCQNSWRSHVKVDNTGRNSIEMRKNTGGSDNRPNILSISQPLLKVNKDFVRNHKIYRTQKGKMDNLYNIPSCNFRKQWYYRYTKRWSQWSLETRLSQQSESRTDVIFLLISSVYIHFL